VNVGNFYLVSIILNKIEPIKPQLRKNLLFFYLIVMLFLPYNWWYFDGLTLIFLLLGLSHFLNKKFLMSVVFISFGVLTKLFPLLFFVVFIKQKLNWRVIIKSISLLILIVGIPYLLLFLISPEMTRASLVSQAMKDS
jgi:energy-coupling factor transporter transmembrane protein EcfT